MAQMISQCERYLAPKESRVRTNQSKLNEKLEEGYP